ncbi:MAG: endo alpha-1,4 polygalactosaminidase [Flavobacteriales bacterium]|nr:endo alpha-1,4 polygalactosaminidase [Flavobacteriales bacterium]
MKSIFFILLSAAFLLSCRNDDEELIPPTGLSNDAIYYRDEMRKFVISIADYGRAADADFIVIPQNGQELATLNGEPAGQLATDYMNTINGQGREELFYGYDNNDDSPTPVDEQQGWNNLLLRMRDEGKTIMITDYCTTQNFVDDSYAQNDAHGYISFAADERDLFSIPVYPNPVHNENNGVITSLDEAQNFLYIINTQEYLTKQDFINAVAATNYDLVLMDAFFDEEEFTPQEINQLRQKTNGGVRLVIAYMSIGEAEDYRPYWEPDWSFNPPDWLGELNPDWPGNYKVHYWDENWQSIIFGNDTSYMKNILDAGFDGVYLDIIDAFEYWE